MFKIDVSVTTVDGVSCYASNRSAVVQTVHSTQSTVKDFKGSAVNWVLTSLYKIKFY